MWPFKNKRKTTASHDPVVSEHDEQLKAILDVVFRYMVFLEDNPMDISKIYDVAALPFEKLLLRNAFQIAVASEHRVKHRDTLVKIGMTLIHFQSGIGPTPLEFLAGIDLDNLDVEATMKKLYADEDGIATAVTRYNEAMQLVNEEREQMTAMFANAVEFAKRQSA